MFKFEIVAENATELKTKIADLALLFDVGEDPRITLAKRVNKVEGVPIDVIKKLELVEKTVNGVAEAAYENSDEAETEEKSEEPETLEEESEENIATKMTYWLAGGEYGSSRKGAVIPDGAKVYGSKSAWDASKDQSEEEEAAEEAEEEEETTTKTNFPVEDAEPVEKSTIIDKMGELLRANGSVKKEIVGLMARFDGSRFSEIAEKDYPEFYAGLMSIEKGGE
ncbi:hypothetical protein ACTQ45_00865 [Fundicoccus sp. Sow4_D5]|uniref:hypothetical protein n=1 Tax=Fundicoccus sp. Sow4_D5 TaxID=3438782 RepID=UPI003F932237